MQFKILPSVATSEYEASLLRVSQNPDHSEIRGIWQRRSVACHFYGLIIIMALKFEVLPFGDENVVLKISLHPIHLDRLYLCRSSSEAISI